MPVVITAIAILALVLLIAWAKLYPFLAFILVSLGLALASGMDVSAAVKSVQTGLGGTLGDLVLIIGFGAMLGRLVAESGAARRITDKLLSWFGDKYLGWGLALAGFIIGIPLFYNAGFIIVAPLILTIAASTRKPLLTIAIPMLTALSVAHGYLPPHPSPAAIAGQLKADVGQTLFYGILVAIPAIAVAGPMFGRTLTRYKPQPDRDLFDPTDRPPLTDLPGAGISFFVALLPVVLLTVIGPLKGYFSNVAPDSIFTTLLTLLAEPAVGMLVSVLVAMWALGLNRGKSLKAVTNDLEEAIKAAAPILLIIGGAGALKQVLADSGTSRYVGEQLAGAALPPLVLGWGMAAIIRVCVGSATIAGLTTVGLMAPLLTSAGVRPELMVLAIGAGSLFLSHLNDPGFWLFKEYFNLTISDTLRTWTVMESLVSVIGLLGVLALNAFLG